jgi:hypothetical protein
LSGQPSRRLPSPALTTPSPEGTTSPPQVHSAPPLSSTHAAPAPPPLDLRLSALSVPQSSPSPSIPPPTCSFKSTLHGAASAHPRCSTRRTPSLDFGRMSGAQTPFAALCLRVVLAPPWFHLLRPRRCPFAPRNAGKIIVRLWSHERCAGEARRAASAGASRTNLHSERSCCPPLVPPLLPSCSSIYAQCSSCCRYPFHFLPPPFHRAC